jgi:hypothetical protein
VGSSDIVYFILICKNIYSRKIKFVYGYDFEGVVIIANGEVGISGSRHNSYGKSTRAQM